MATAEDQGRVRVWRTETGKLDAEFSVRNAPIRQMVFSNDKGNLYALVAASEPDSVDFDTRLLRWDLKRGQFGNAVRLRSRYPLDGAHEMELSQDGGHVVIRGHELKYRFDLSGAPVERQGGWELRHGKWALSGQPPVLALEFHPGNGGTVSTPWEYDSIRKVVESPTGNRIAMVVEREQDSRRCSVLVMDGRTGRRIAAFDLGMHWFSLRRFPLAMLDDERLLMVSENRIAVLSTSTGKFIEDAKTPRWTLGHVAFDAHGRRTWLPSRFAVSTDGRTLAYLNHERAVRIWDLAAGKEVDTSSNAHTAAVLGTEFSYDRSRLLTCGDDRSVRLWDVATTKQLWAESFEHPMRACFAPDFRYVLAYESGALKVLDAKTGMQVFSQTRTANDRLISSAQFGPDARKIWLADRSGIVEQWSLVDGKRKKTIKVAVYPPVSKDERQGEILDGPRNAGRSPNLSYPAIIPHWQGPRIISPIDRRTLGAFDTLHGHEILRVNAETPWWDGVKSMGRGTFMASIVLEPGEPFYGRDGTVEMRPARKHSIHVYRATDFSLQNSLTVDATGTNAVALSANGRLLACGDSLLPILRIVRMTDGRVTQRISRLPAMVSSLAFSDDGKQIAAGLVDSQVLVWNVSQPE